MVSALIDVANNKDLFACFGYGSLVNRKTLSPDLVAVFRATLTGWRRQWQARPANEPSTLTNEPVSLLSVRKEADCSIDGLIFIEHRKNLASLEIREKFYTPNSIRIDDISCEASYLQILADKQIHVYAVPPTPADAQPGVLLRSYLDVVMQGFLAEYGEAGLARFIDTTDWFDLTVFEDRDAPVYPRHQQLNSAEIELFNSFIPQTSKNSIGA